MTCSKTLNPIKEGEKVNMDRLTYNVKELPDILGIGITKTYQMINNGSIPNIRFGRRIIIPKDSLEKFLKEKANESLIK
jgi:excisionase family DNA binding protein